ncbi:GNAT family N-acetyltransferase [Rhizobium sp. RU36D]|uniref:GNAT family N-acetyltransferase n=1 Tax=Rhizobium sp. RU36D TaxID=1907415 RepID=UPI0009D8375C|nr:GNAT family N-acetyltransferase [Rhizobium sp. RU36D]SMC44651.1 hypothetical protein SAMN05880593_101411 [Rhizobium sp. RU36D]
MTSTSLQIRPLDLDHLRLLLRWAAEEGWNPGIADAEPFLAADPQDFLSGFVGDEMVAGISAVRYGEDFGFIGLYICRPDKRGLGYGREVWDAGMRHLEGRTIGLDGVPAQQANYAAMGFRPAYNTYRWSGPAETFSDGSSIVAIVDLNPAMMAAVAAYDRRCFPAERNDFLSRWVAEPRIARLAMRGDVLVGYAVARRCLEGHKIGPVFADDAETAWALVTGLAQAIGSGPIHLDVPETSSEFSKLLEAAGFQRGFVTARMYRGTPPVLRQDGVFAVTTLELG